MSLSNLKRILTSMQQQMAQEAGRAKPGTMEHEIFRAKADTYANALLIVDNLEDYSDELCSVCAWDETH